MKTIQEYIEEMKARHHFIASGVWHDIVADEPGKKYVRICSILSNGQRSAIAFIDPMVGIVYKARSWKQRGRIVDYLYSEKQKGAKQNEANHS